MVFEKGRSRIKKREWKWREEEIEEVKEIKYLEYTLQKNRDWETYKRKDKESNSGNEENMEHWRNNIQRQLRKENEDIQFFGGEYSPVWSGDMGLVGRQ